MMFMELYITIFRLVKKLHDVKGKQFVTAFTKSFKQFYSVCMITSKYTTVIALYTKYAFVVYSHSFMTNNVCVFIALTIRGVVMLYLVLYN